MEDEQFKVIDKRGRDAEPGKPAGSAPKASEPSPQEEPTPVDFPSFIVGLATQAMMLLGEMPDPHTGSRLPVNLAGARQTIDIIAMLQERTKGNLTSDEEKLIQDILTSLRLSYIKKVKG